MGFADSSARKESTCNAGDPGLITGSGRSPEEKIGYTPVFLDFPGGLDSKDSTCKLGDLGLISGLGRSPGGGHGSPLQYSCLESPHGQRSLVGYSPWGHKGSDRTERLSAAQHIVALTLLCKVHSQGSTKERLENVSGRTHTAQ